MIVWTCFLAWIPAPACAQEAPPRTFELEGTIREAIARDLDGNGSIDLALVGHRPAGDGTTQRILRFFAGSPKGPQPRSFHEMHPPAQWTAIAFLDWIPIPGEELLVLDPHGARVHPLDPAREPGTIAYHPQGRTLLEGPLYFERADPHELLVWPYVDSTEAWVPLPRGYRRIARLRGGRGAPMETLDLSNAMVARRLYDGSVFSVERELPLPILQDVDGDGVRDIAYETANDRRILVHLGETEDGAPVSSSPIQLEAGDRFAAAQDTVVEKTFRKLVDLDGDGRVGLLAWRILGDIRGGMKFETRLSVHRAAARPQPHRFELAQELLFAGVAAVTDAADLNGDRSADLVIARTESVVMAALTGTAQVSYSLYLCGADGRFSTQPTAEFSQQIPVSILKEKDLRVGRLPRAADIVHDFDGDGVTDLFQVQSGSSFTIRRGHLVHRTHDGRRWDTLRYDGEPWLELEGPTSYRYEITDLDADGRPDLLFIHADHVSWIDLP